MRKFKTLITFLLIVTSQNSIAALTLEPFYDSMFSDSTREKNAPSGSDESKFENAGTAFGARLYVSFKTPKAMAFAGFQGMLSESTWTLTEPTSLVDSQDEANEGLKDKWRGKHAGLVFGVYNNNFETWAAAMSTEFKDRNAEGSFGKNDELRGMTIEVGFGIKLLSWFKINATYRNHKLGNYRDSSTSRSYDLPNKDITYGDYDVKEYFLGVSMPITIGKR